MITSAEVAMVPITYTRGYVCPFVVRVAIIFICIFLNYFSIDGLHRILVATSDGTFYVGNIDPRDGGECRITKEFRLLSRPGEFLHGHTHQQQSDETMPHVS